jgi:adenosine deaminase
MTRDAAVTGLPKVALHDHLDGGVRVGTVLELADELGYRDLPAFDADGLAAWFFQGRSGSLTRYLAAFEHTVAVMQTPGSLERVALEAVHDLAADGVVYAELRFGPRLHTRRGLALEDVIEATLSGLERGRAETGMVVGLIPSALRDQPDSESVAIAAARFSDDGVVGFDIAGPEVGYPADDHLPAFRVIHDTGLGLTIHAGEADGPYSIFRAVARCGAHRIGHGVRIVDDLDAIDGQVVALGALARRIRDHRIHLEIAVRSNVHTGVVAEPAAHPLAMLHRAGFSVSINTDNRLMSGVSTADEYGSAEQDQGLSVAEIGEITEEALRAGFGSWTERRRLIATVVRPAYGLS